MWDHIGNNLLFVWLPFRFLERSIYIFVSLRKGSSGGKSNLVLDCRPPYLVFDYQCWRKNVWSIHTGHFTFLDYLPPLYCDSLKYLYIKYSLELQVA